MNDPKKPARPMTTERDYRPPGDPAEPGDRLRTNEARDDQLNTTSDIARSADEHARDREREAMRADQTNAAQRAREMEQRGSQARMNPPGNGTDTGNGETLFTPDMLRDLRDRWTRVQSEFVDEPRKAVEDADHLVAEAVKDLAETFSAARNRLESTWDRQGQVSTEDLRQTLRRYRTFFDRLLSV